MTLLSRYAISLIVGLSSLAVAWWGWSAYYVEKGVQSERVRVEKKAKQLNANAKRAADRARSDPDRVLSKYIRD